MFPVFGQRLPGIILAFVSALGIAVASIVSYADDSRPAVMMLVSASQEPDSGLVVDAIAAQLSDLDVSFRVEALQNLPSSLPEQIALAGTWALEESVIAVFWYDLSEGGNVYLFLAGPGGERILARKLEDSQDRGRAEGLAIIVRSSVMAMLQGGQIGITVEEAVAAAEPGPVVQLEEPSPAPPPIPAPAQAQENPPAAERMHLRLAYSYHARSEKQPAVSGMEVGLGVRVAWKLHVLASYTILQPVEHNGDLASLRVRGHPVGLGLGLLFDVGPVTVGGSAKLVLDVEKQEVTRLEEGLVPEGDDTDIVLGVNFAVEAIMGLARRLDVFLAVGITSLFNPVRYTVSLAKRREVLVDTWPVQPWVQVGIRVALF